MNVEVVAQSLPKHIVVLGAGPAGLAVGHELTSQGVGVTVLERNDYVGGLCRTVSEEGYKFDLGGHRWFTKNEDLNHWFRNLMEGELVLVNRISRIYHDGTFFLYPITLGDIFEKLILFINIIKRIDLLSLLTIGGICPKIKTLNHQFKCW